MRSAARPSERTAGIHTDRPAMLFDLDGTLIDSVYQHVLAWKEALASAGIELSIWRIHRRIGMSGGVFGRALVRETGREITEPEAGQLRAQHEAGYRRRNREVTPPPGAQKLLKPLTGAGGAGAVW